MITWIRSGLPGPVVCFSFGVHGNERPPIEAGLALKAMLERDGLDRGALLLVVGNPEAVAQGLRWSRGGVDLNRCFHPETLRQPARLAEHHRARALVAAMAEVAVLVDFHCTVEPGERFTMHHPDDATHRDIDALLGVSVSVADPELVFGGVSLDEHLSTTGRTGVCYETGWIGDPANTPARILDQMRNVLRGLGLLLDAPATRQPPAQALVLTGLLRCPPTGFTWASGVGHNLQHIPTGTVLGTDGNHDAIRLTSAAVLLFPKKQPELVTAGLPLVYMACLTR